MDTQLQQKIINANGIFEKSFLDSKVFYMYCYQRPPCIAWVSQSDNDRVLAYVKQVYGAVIKGIYQYSEYERKKKKTEFYRTIVLLEGHCMLELASDYCQILYSYEDDVKAHALLKELSQFKKREKKSNFSINLVVKDDYGMELKSMDIKKTRLDLDLYYEDDFAEVDRIIRKRLNKKEDKGIVLLHGLAGAGKTTYLRHLVGRISKKVLFLSPGAARNIMDPEFMDLLLDNPDCVLVIEDAESLISDRKVNEGSSVSDLLNITDGLLADMLHVQVICTFNHPLSMVDGALLRKGRLIAGYEFGRLSVKKAQCLSDHMGFSTVIGRPMTIAEISGQLEKDFAATQKVRVVGFRREAERLTE